MPPFRPAEERFWEKVRKTESCWNWIAAKVQGYGWFHVSRSNTAMPAYRFSYELLIGPIPKGMELHHTCLNHACVNPAHLEMHTKASHPDFVANVNRAKTHCPKGHRFSEENTYSHPRKNGTFYRSCRMCDCLRARKRYRKRQRKKQTHCRLGHPLYQYGKQQFCVTCRNATQRRRRARYRDKRLLDGRGLLPAN